MARWTLYKDAIVLSLTSWPLWLVQFVGNVIIFLAFVWWLRLPDAHWWQLLFGLLLIIFSATAALVLHGGTLDFFQIAHQKQPGGLASAFRKALRHLPAVAGWAVGFVVLQWLVGELDQYAISLPGYLRSEFPAWLRRMISEPRLDSIFNGIVWLLRWVFVPGLLLPFALSSAANGFRGLIAFREWKRAAGSPGYWIVLLLAALLSVLSIQALMGMKPDPKTSTVLGDETSLVFRLLLAYLLGIFCWLLACSVLGRKTAQIGGESGSQPV